MKKNISIDFGFLHLLALTFIILKLCKVISWSWFWVLSPILIPVSILLLILLIIALVLGLGEIYK